MFRHIHLKIGKKNGGRLLLQKPNRKICNLFLKNNFVFLLCQKTHVCMREREREKALPEGPAHTSMLLLPILHPVHILGPRAYPARKLQGLGLKPWLAMWTLASLHSP